MTLGNLAISSLHCSPRAQKMEHRACFSLHCPRGGVYEKDLAEVNGEVEVVVAEGRVLLRVEHLQQRRARVPTEVAAEL
eukprot:gene123-39_t